MRRLIAWVIAVVVVWGVAAWWSQWRNPFTSMSTPTGQAVHTPFNPEALRIPGCKDKGACT